MESSSSIMKKIFIVPIVLAIFMWVVLFIPAGTLKYLPGWIFWCGFTLITFFIGIYFVKRNPEFLARRTKVKGDKSSNKSPAYYKLFYLGFILPGLDFRFHWSNEPLWVIIAANIIALAGYIFIFYVFKENSYASTVITVEDEQKVISSGPYGLVRHPMYTGMILMALFMPLALGSYFAFIPMLLIIPITVTRINNEEKLLIKELKGYKEYCDKTKYRLIPYIW